MKPLLKTVLDYNTWANQQVWTCVARLTDDQFRQAHDYSIGSVYEQVYHLMSTDYWTLKILDATCTDDPPQKEDYTTREAIWRRWQAIDQALHTWLDNATDDELREEVGVQETDDLNIAGSRAEYVIVTENHTTNHRAQILARIHQLGGDTCEMGFYFYIRERALNKLETT